jgi:hypothetical protein
MTKIDRQPACSISTPPRTGPVAKETADPAAQTATARTRRAGSSKTWLSSESEVGSTSAAPTPSSAWAAMSAAAVGASVAATEPAAKVPRPARKTVRAPSRSAARPVDSRRPAKTSVYALATHSSVVGPADRSRAIDPSATLTTVVSSSTIEKPRVLASRTSRSRRVTKASR